MRVTGVWRRSGAVKVLVTGALMVALAGCATEGGAPGALATDANLSPYERELRERHDRARLVQGAVVGCVAGGIGTALLVAALGGGGNQVAGAALGGCAVGAAVGVASGAYVNARNKQYSDQNDYYRSLNVALDQDIARYRQLNETTRALIGDQERRVAALNLELEQGSIDEAAYRRRIGPARDNLRILRRNVEEAADNLRTVDGDINTVRQAGGDLSSLTQRRAQLERERQDLERLVSDLAAVYDDVPPGVRSAIL